MSISCLISISISGLLGCKFRSCLSFRLTGRSSFLSSPLYPKSITRVYQLKFNNDHRPAEYSGVRYSSVETRANHFGSRGGKGWHLFRKRGGGGRGRGKQPFLCLQRAMNIPGGVDHHCVLFLVHHFPSNALGGKGNA